MKKEKTVKTYQRRTKTGKVVTVRQHTAKYDASDKAKEMATKKGAGEELAAKKGMPDHNLPMNEYLEELKKLRKGETPEEAPVEKETKKSSPSAEKKSKSVKSTKTTKSAATTQANGVSASDFKSWYHFNDWDKPKKSWPAEVRAADAAIRKQLGSKKAYDDYCAQIDSNYSKRGHSTAFTTFGNLASGNAKGTKSSTADTKATKSKSSQWYNVAYAPGYGDKGTPQHEAVVNYVNKVGGSGKSTPFAEYTKKLFDKGYDSFDSLKPNHWKKLYSLMESESKTKTKATSSKAKPTKGGKNLGEAETKRLVNSAIRKASRKYEREISGLFADSILNEIPREQRKRLSPNVVWSALDAANMRHQKKRNKYDPGFRANPFSLDEIKKALK